MKTKRLLAFLLIAVFVIGVMPLAVAADGGTLDCDREHTHTDDCYELDCELGEHTHSSDQNSTCTREWCSYKSNPDHYEWNSRKHEWQHKQGLPGSKREGNGRYKCCTKAEHTHSEIGGSCYIRICNYEEEHEHGPECYVYEYTITVLYIYNDQPLEDIDHIVTGTLKGAGPITVDVSADSTRLPEGFKLADEEDSSTQVKISYPTLTGEARFNVEKITYDYQVYVQYKDGDNVIVEPTLVQEGTFKHGEPPTVPVSPDATVLPTGYMLEGNPETVEVEVDYPEEGNEIFTYTVTFEVAPIPNVPPQVIYPTPAPEIEVPEEEIPTTQPEEEEEVDFEEEEEFEDEEIPTDVPQTGDSSPLYIVFALISLAGAAFALTLKRSRNIG